MLTLQPLRDLAVDPATHPRGQPHLSSASGLVCAQGRAYVVADDEQHLGVFDDLRAPDLAYADGPCAASAVGLVDAGGTLQALRRLVPAHKVEGLAARLQGGAIALCLVSDADDPGTPSRLFAGRW